MSTASDDLAPMLEQLLEQFAFVILSFHADKGSRYINRHGVKRLKKRPIELTKSCAGESNDNALVASKEWLHHQQASGPGSHPAAPGAVSESVSS